MEVTVGGIHDRNDLTEEAIRNELAVVLSSPEFKTKPTLARFLQFIVDESPAGHAHQLKGFTIAIQVLKKKRDFDAAKDPSVRILAGRLRTSLERYYSTSGRKDPIQIEVPKGAYVPVFRRRSVKETTEQPSMSRSNGQEVSDPPGPGIAVMPMRNHSVEVEAEHFAEGLMEELVVELVRYQDFRVVPCHAMARMRGMRIGARELGQELNVRFLLEGSVRKEGGSIKITVGLIDTATEIQIWGERYRRDYDDGSLIQLQEEVAASVVAKLGDYFGVIPQQMTRESRTITPEALGGYQAFLRMREYSFALTEEAFSRALEGLEHVSKHSPDSGMVWAMLANLYADNNTLWSGDLDVSMERALACARKGANLEPQNQYARTIFAYLHLLVNERDGFFREAEAALELNPNSLMLTAFLGWMFAIAGEWDRGLQLLERRMTPSPYFPGWFHMAPCLRLYGDGRYEPAYRRALRIQTPRFLWDPLLRAAALGQLGRSTEARRALDELLQLRTDFPSSAPRHIGYFAKTDGLVHAILEGLSNAGLKI
jgi:adenylate cyclase